MLARQELREFVVKKLRSDAKLAKLVGKNILNSKVTPFEGKTLPGINVVTPSQNATSRSLNIPSFTTSLKLNVEIYVAAMDAWTAKADTIAEAVEECLLSDPEFAGQISDITSYDVEYSLYDQGVRPIVVEILSFSLSYFQEYHPRIEDDFAEAHIKVDVIDPIADPHPGPDGRIEFEVNARPGEENARKTKPE